MTSERVAKLLADLIAIRPLALTDTESAEQLIRASFEPRLHPYIAYCQPGVARFLATTIEQRRALPDYHLYAAEDSHSRQLVAFAEFRSTGPEVDLLSYICVAPAARGRKLAERLIRHHLRMQPSTRRLELDVFAHNNRARKLYERLGFEEVGSMAWWSRPVTQADDRAHVRLMGWHASVATMAAFGFTMITVETDRGLLTVGHPSPSIVRLPNQSTFHDDSLLGTFREVIPTLEQAMLIAPHSPTDEPPGAHILDSLRLHAETSQW